MLNRRRLLATLISGSVVSSAYLGLSGCASAPQPTSDADLAELDVTDQVRLVASRELSALELTEAAIRRIEMVNSRVNAVVTTSFDQARAQAVSADPKGALWGVPYLFKDLNDYAGVRSTFGSRAFLRNVAQAQSAYTDQTLESGVIVLGKTNTPEFGLISTTESLALGACRNPWNLEHSVGGSSGGAAASVACGMVAASQGGDGGGSIRIPAAQCGVFGLKPSAGRFPDQGTPAKPWPISIKHALTRTVRDSALILAATESQAGPLAPVGVVTPKALSSQRIALSLRNAYGELPDPAIQQAMQEAADLLANLGHEIVEIEQTPMSGVEFGNQFLVNWQRMASDIMARLEAQAPGIPVDQLLEPWTVGLARHYRSLPSDALAKALEQFEVSQRAVNRWFETYDAWLTPVTGSTAPPLGEQAPTVSYEVLMDRVLRFAAFTPIHNVAGTPGASIPMGLSDAGLPVAVQLSAGFGNEQLILELAYQMEEAKPWKQLRPPVFAA